VTKAVRPNSAAEAEFRESIRWYEGRVAGLGDRLWFEIQAAINLIARYPEIGEVVRRLRVRQTVRRLRLSHFPFLLIYREFDDHLEVIALAHTSRKPKYWRSRLT
jgi:plasmid stabilization system protein ParE